MSKDFDFDSWLDDREAEMSLEVLSPTMKARLAQLLKEDFNTCPGCDDPTHWHYTNELQLSKVVGR